MSSGGTWSLWGKEIKSLAAQGGGAGISVAVIRRPTSCGRRVAAKSLADHYFRSGAVPVD